MKISVYTIGCKVNQYESDSLINALKSKGYEVTDSLDYADVYIINTCAVTNEAERKSRQCITRARKHNANASVYVMGCASQNNSEQFKYKDGVIFIGGSASKSRLALFEELEGIQVNELPDSYEDDMIPLSLRTRTYVKVQDGCNNYCSYCIIPYLRGRSRSRDINSIIEEINIQTKTSKEIVLTGINLSAYGKDIGTDLVALLNSIKAKALRLRLGSLEVNVINDEFLLCLSNIDEFCQHFHLSLQSGDDQVLKDMNRHYNSQIYIDKVNLIRKYFPEAAITTDIIVGYPTESEEAFNNTINLVNIVRFSNIHCFPYSSRKGTGAYKHKALSSDIVRSRMSILEKTRDKYRDEYNSLFIGKKLEVLFEDNNNNTSEGYSRNYIKVYSDNNYCSNDLVVVKPTQIYKEGLKV